MAAAKELPTETTAPEKLLPAWSQLNAPGQQAALDALADRVDTQRLDTQPETDRLAQPRNQRRLAELAAKVAQKRRSG